ncbi:MAG: SNF2 helicase associated domain-containing protein [Clostridia bacterium]
MKISPKVINNISSGLRYKKACTYVRQGKVRITKVDYIDEENFTLESIVVGKFWNYSVVVKTKNAKSREYDCTCPDCIENEHMCKHIMATLLEIYMKEEYKNIMPSQIVKFVEEENIKKQMEEELFIKGLEKDQELKKKQEEYDQAQNMINDFYHNAIGKNTTENTAKSAVPVENGTVHLTPRLSVDNYNDSMKLDFKIGVKQMYKLKNFVEFLAAMKSPKSYKHGAKLDFVHRIEKFDEESKKVLPLVLKYCEYIKYANSKVKLDYYYSPKLIPTNYISLDGEAIDEIFEIYNEKVCEIDVGSGFQECLFLESDPSIGFELNKKNKDEYALSMKDGYNSTISVVNGLKYSYVIKDDILYRCSNEFSTGTLNLLKIFNRYHKKEFLINKSMLSEVLTIVAPKVKSNLITKNIDKKELEKYIPKELGVKLFLDFDRYNNIIANVLFCYGDNEFNPLSKTELDFPNNVIAERKIGEKFAETGFKYLEEKDCLLLEDEEQIYDFLSEGINNYMEEFEVLATDNFKKEQIRQPRIGTIGVKIENNLLNIDFSKMDIDSLELKELMQKYKIKKKYHRLKDGSFINLEDDENINFLNNLTDGMGVDYKSIAKGNISVPMHRTMYLEKLLDNMENIETKKDSQYKKIVDNVENSSKNDEIKIPKNLDKTLRYYQKTGFRWLKGLDEYKFGGILADDMGLGKTLQIITLFDSYLQSKTKKGENSKKKTSIVVCPSSLSINWKNEIKKFSNEITTMVISGKAEERCALIKSIPDYDVVITSYDLLKRDIEQYSELKYTFKYIVADEAQYIKNSNTKNATAIKTIKAETKFALTGTPIENSIAELWSIFDFCMPGYLFSYNKFKKNYETPIVKENDEKVIKKLKMMIQPFILRRMKKEVLTELPDKTITVLTNEMSEEQNKIYLSYLAQAKQEFASELNTNGFEKSRIKILALLTRLRQICCHPGLFIENYDGESSKLNQCIEILHDNIDSGHKVLLFSQFTSMFPYLERALEKENIKFFKLTGSTKVDERIKMVDDFNENPAIKVFLISLKAGGTGLNLTGADVVMHYDPWWNLSAENQATDRTYRIGQKNSVQVYKFITQNSIEEKINELQVRKAKLSENLLKQGETFIDKLSKEDIMALFD